MELSTPRPLVSYSFSVREGGMIRIAVVGATVLLGACLNMQEVVVRDKAIIELPCPRDTIDVVQLTREENISLFRAKGPHEPYPDPTLYRAEGCGKHMVFVCQGWDSYNQKALCEPRF